MCAFLVELSNDETKYISGRIYIWAVNLFLIVSHFPQIFHALKPFSAPYVLSTLRKILPICLLIIGSPLYLFLQTLDHIKWICGNQEILVVCPR